MFSSTDRDLHFRVPLKLTHPGLFLQPGAKIHYGFRPALTLENAAAQLEKLSVDRNRFLLASGRLVVFPDKGACLDAGGAKDPLPGVLGFLERLPVFVSDLEDPFLTALGHPIENCFLFEFVLFPVIHFTLQVRYAGCGGFSDSRVDPLADSPTRIV
jgi:hypothetical protein